MRSGTAATPRLEMEERGLDFVRCGPSHQLGIGCHGNARPTTLPRFELRIVSPPRDGDVRHSKHTTLALDENRHRRSVKPNRLLTPHGGGNDRELCSGTVTSLTCRTRWEKDRSPMSNRGSGPLTGRLDPGSFAQAARDCPTTSYANRWFHVRRSLASLFTRLQTQHPLPHRTLRSFLPPQNPFPPR